VRDIDVHGVDLVIATHGRGFWIMDDVSALRQLTGTPGPTLFRPADAVRMKLPLFTGTPMPKDEPIAPNPPPGAYIDYVLPPGAKGTVSLTVYDAQNRKVSAFASTDKAFVPDAATLEFAPEWMPSAPALSTAPGMHRFVWDLHYPAHPGFGGDEGPPEGVWAPPGHYTVELDAGGAKLRQPLLVKADPRVKIADAALMREFALAQKAESAGVEAATATADATKLLKALEARIPGEKKLQGQMTALAAKVTDLSGVDLHPDPRNSMGRAPHRMDSLRALTGDFAKLKSAIDAADADPGKDSIAAYATLTKMLTATLHEWQQVRSGDLAALNAGLKAAGEKAIAL
jgi:hypothetical protein